MTQEQEDKKGVPSHPSNRYATECPPLLLDMSPPQRMDGAGDDNMPCLVVRPRKLAAAADLADVLLSHTSEGPVIGGQD